MQLEYFFKNIFADLFLMYPINPIQPNPLFLDLVQLDFNQKNVQIQSKPNWRTNTPNNWKLWDRNWAVQKEDETSVCYDWSRKASLPSCMKFLYTSGGMILHRVTYTSEILTKFIMIECNIAVTLAYTNMRLVGLDDGKE